MSSMTSDGATQANMEYTNLKILRDYSEKISSSLQLMSSVLEKVERSNRYIFLSTGGNRYVF